jgi:hypothetical protein
VSLASSTLTQDTLSNVEILHLEETADTFSHRGNSKVVLSKDEDMRRSCCLGIRKIACQEKAAEF